MSEASQGVPPRAFRPDTGCAGRADRAGCEYGPGPRSGAGQFLRPRLAGSGDRSFFQRRYDAAAKLTVSIGEAGDVSGTVKTLANALRSEMGDLNARVGAFLDQARAGPAAAGVAAVPFPPALSEARFPGVP